MGKKQWESPASSNTPNGSVVIRSIRSIRSLAPERSRGRSGRSSSRDWDGPGWHSAQPGPFPRSSRGGCGPFGDPCSVWVSLWTHVTVETHELYNIVQHLLFDIYIYIYIIYIYKYILYVKYLYIYSFEPTKPISLGCYVVKPGITG